MITRKYRSDSQISSSFLIADFDKYDHVQEYCRPLAGG